MKITTGLLLLLLFLFFTRVSAQETNSIGKIYQLREYQLLSEYKDAFYSNFESHTRPIMESYGFNILNVWISNDNFLYLLEWNNLTEMNNQWSLFKSDEKWIIQKKAFSQKYGDVVKSKNEHILREVSLLSNSDQKVENGGFPKLNIGQIECIALSDGFVTLPVQPSIAPFISHEIVVEKLKENFRNEDVINYPINVLLLKKEEYLILIDAGQGATSNKNAGRLVKNLQTVGINPSDITDIIISHAHTDHIDGLIDEQGKSIYKDATIYLSRVEYEFWKSVDNDFGKAINAVLSIVEPQIRLFEDGAIIHNCIRNEIVSGHTPGHVICTIFSEDKELTAINDLVLDELIISHPDWGSGFDGDFEQAKSTRREILLRLCNNKSLVWGCHLSYPGIGHISKTSEYSYKWNPQFLSNPLP